MDNQFVDMSNKDYHSLEQISKSDLDRLAKSPYHYKYKDMFPQLQTSSLTLGSVVHKLLLEPDDFNNEYIIEPKFDKRTKEGKLNYEVFLAHKGSKIAISEDDYLLASMIRNTASVDNYFNELVTDGVAEKTFISNLDDVAVKCRPDYFNIKSNILVDLKTTKDASYDGFMSSVMRYNYDIQAVFYMDIMKSLGHEIRDFIFIAIETTAPYVFGYYKLSNELLAKARTRYQYLLKLYKECKRTNNWFKYSQIVDGKVHKLQVLKEQ